MDVNKVKVLLQAVETGNLLNTAKNLGYTQAGLTHMMNSLESELGIQLLRRGKFGVRLTEEGQRLLPLFQELTSIEKKIRQEVDSILEQKASVIRLASIASVIRTWLPDVMMTFQQNDPEISFEIKEGDDRIYQWFDQGQVDLCISCNMSPRDDFVPLLQDDFYAVLPENYPLKEGEAFPIERLETEKFLVPSCANDYDVAQILESYGIHIRNQSTHVDDNSAMSMVARGFGISLLPQLVLANCHENVRTAPLNRPCYRRIGILYDGGKNVSPAVKKFVTFLKSWDFKNSV